MLQTLLLIAALIGFTLLIITAHTVKQAIVFSIGVWAAIVGLCILYLRDLHQGCPTAGLSSCARGGVIDVSRHGHLRNRLRLVVTRPVAAPSRCHGKIHGSGCENALRDSGGSLSLPARALGR